MSERADTDPRSVRRINGILEGVPAGDSARAAEAVIDAAGLAHWDEHGFVVVRGAVPREACAAAEAAVWAHLGMDPAAPATWYREPPAVVTAPIDDPALWATRGAPRVRDAFAQLWRRTDLAMAVLGCGMTPPERPDWRFPGPHLHFDVDVVTPLPFGVQGVLYLTDTAKDHGAFSCIPGFHRRIDAWARSLPAAAHASSQPLHELGPRVRIAGEAGDLVLWHHALPHAPTPNRGERPRVVQYVRMFPRRAA